MPEPERVSPSFALGPDELEAFHRNGYAGPFTLYEPEEMTSTWKTVRRQLFDRRFSVYPDEEAVSGATNIANYDRHLDVSFLSQHVCRPGIVHRVASILGPDVLCWRTEFFPKYPGDEGTDWHQADTFQNASGRPQIVWPGDTAFGGTITAWTAFTEATEENGCLRFIPGTHRTRYYDETKGMRYEPDKIGKMFKDGGVKRGFFGYDYRSLQVDPDWTPDESKAISMVMRPGQFILFWSTLMHASLPHLGLTEEMRLGFVARYVPTKVRIYPDTDVLTEYGGSVPLDKYGAVLVCGRNDYDFNRIAAQNTRGQAFVQA